MEWFCSGEWIAAPPIAIEPPQPVSGLPAALFSFELPPPPPDGQRDGNPRFSFVPLPHSMPKDTVLALNFSASGAIPVIRPPVEHPEPAPAQPEPQPAPVAPPPPAAELFFWHDLFGGCSTDIPTPATSTTTTTTTTTVATTVSSELTIAVYAADAVALIANPAAKTSFEAAFATDIGAVLGINATRITVTSVTAGSLLNSLEAVSMVVGFIVTSAATDATVFTTASFTAAIDTAGSIPLNAVLADAAVTAITGTSIPFPTASDMSTTMCSEFPSASGSAGGRIVYRLRQINIEIVFAKLLK